MRGGAIAAAPAMADPPAATGSADPQDDRIITGALGFGYLGSFPSYDPWISWARHVVGARVVVSVNRAIDTPHDWSATLGLEVDPISAVHALYDLVTGR